MNNNDEEAIIIETIEMLKKILANKSYRSFRIMIKNSKIMVKGIKKHTTDDSKAPTWFDKWVKNSYQKDIKQINSRLDNIVKRNNLLE